MLDSLVGEGVTGGVVGPRVRPWCLVGVRVFLASLGVDFLKSVFIALPSTFVLSLDRTGMCADTYDARDYLSCSCSCCLNSFLSNQRKSPLWSIL